MPPTSRRRGTRAIIVSLAALAACSAVAQSAQAAMIGDYSRRSAWYTNWASPSERIQEIPRASGPLGGPPDASLSNEIRVEMRDGDPQMGYDQTAGGKRHELQTGTVWNTGDVRWVGWWEYVEKWPAVNKDWQIIFQAKQSGGTSPGVDVQVWADTIRLVTPWAAVNTPLVAPLPRGRWFHVAIGFKMTTNASAGWAEMWIDGKQVGSRYVGKTAQLESGVYMKTGLYRADSIMGQSIRHVAGMRIYDTRPLPAGTSTTPDPTPAPPPAVDTVPALGQAVPAGNVEQNPSFAGGLANWATVNANGSIVTTTDGGKVALLTRTAGSTFTIDDVAPAVAAANPGDTYTATSWVRAANAASVGTTARVRIREAGQQDVAGTLVTLTSGWQKVTATLTARGSNAIDARVDGNGSVAGQAMNVGFVSVVASQAPAPPPSTGGFVNDGFEGLAPGASGSPWTVFKDTGNTVSVVTSPVASGSQAVSLTKTSGGRASVGTSFAGTSTLSASAAVRVASSTLAVNRVRVMLRVLAVASKPSGARVEAGMFRTSDGKNHWAVWQIDRNGVQTKAAISAAAPVVGSWQTVRLNTQWARTGAVATLAVGGEKLSAPAADMTGVSATAFELGNVWSNSADPATIAVDETVVSSESMLSLMARGKSRARSTGRLVSLGNAFATRPIAASRGARVKIGVRVAHAGRIVVTVRNGRTVVARTPRYVPAGGSSITFRAPRRAGTYSVRVEGAGAGSLHTLRVG